MKNIILAIVMLCLLMGSAVAYGGGGGFIVPTQQQYKKLFSYGESGRLLLFPEISSTKITEQIIGAAIEVHRA